jgi:hypothetical protein
MILKVEYYEKEALENPHHCHARVIEVFDFHIETRSKESRKDDPRGAHELVCHSRSGDPCVLRFGFDKEYPDHLYVMENGKTTDHMRFYDN